MSISRRRVVQAAALTPVVSMLPRLSRLGSATVPGTPISPGEIIPVDPSGGFSLSWIGTESGRTVATAEPLVNNRWHESITVADDHGHGPPDPTGRAHSPAIIVAGASSFRIFPTLPIDDLRFHQISDPASSAAGLGALGTSDGYTTVSPMPGLEVFERSNWATRGRRDTVDCYLRSSVLGLGCRSDVGLRHGIVHHTVNTNGYAPDEVPRMLRLIQSYHMDTRGWDDIGYNFVVDRFGRLWQARQGDIYEPITAGHTSGLNAESVGVAVLGTFTSTDPGQDVVDTLGKLLGWKLGLHGVDPLGYTSVRSAGGDYAERGEMVLLRTISGHRDNQQTACPGNVLYARLDEIRTAASELVPVFGNLNPSYRLDSIGLTGWAIDRFDPSTKVEIDIKVDGLDHNSVQADRESAGLSISYPLAGDLHGFSESIPIDIDTNSLDVTARSGDGRFARLMSLTLFAGFIDVEPTRFFAPGVYWLRQNDLTTGTQPGLFEPMDEVTRAVMATFLWRFMDRPPSDSELPFSDVPAKSFYTDAVTWLHDAGVTTGTSPTEFSPDDWVTRAQMAAFLWRLCGSIRPGSPSPFKDVPPGAFYTDAVAWLWEIGVTTGLTDTLYGPHDPVTRGELATFLHRLATEPEAWTVTTAPSSVTIPV